MALCQGLTVSGGRRCLREEIEGMDYCLSHMPDELLEEAEEVVGCYRCRHAFGMPDACHSYAVEGTEPPRCNDHGANLGSKSRLGATLRVINGQADQRAAEIMAEYGSALAIVRPVQDPYQELMQLGGEMRAFKDVMQSRVSQMEIASWRYTGKAGEQVRAEVVLYERAIERYGSMLIAIAKLNLDARLVGIRQQTLAMLDQALTLAFTKAKVPPERQAEARETFRAHIKLVS